MTVASETGCQMVVTLGALLGDVPHTRRVRVPDRRPGARARQRADLLDRVTRPDRIVGVLHDRAG